MPRVTHVKKARKDHPRGLYKAGDSYYWWKFRNGGKQVSLTPPQPWQLTQSPFKQSLYKLQAEMDALTDSSDPDELETFIDQVREMGEECQESLDNMPDSLQYSPSGELLQERIDAADSAADEMDVQKGEFEQAKEARDELEEPTEPSRDDFDDGEDGDEAYDEAMMEFDDLKSDYDDEWDRLTGEMDDAINAFREAASELDV